MTSREQLEAIVHELVPPPAAEVLIEMAHEPGNIEGIRGIFKDALGAFAAREMIERLVAKGELTREKGEQ